MKRVLVWALVPLMLVGCSVPFRGKPTTSPAGEEPSTWNPLKASPAGDLNWLVVGSVLAMGIGIAAAVNGSSSAIGWTVGAGVSLVLTIMLQRYGNLVALGAGLLVMGSVAWFVRSLFLTGGFLSLKRPNSNRGPTETTDPAGPAAAG